METNRLGSTRTCSGSSTAIRRRLSALAGVAVSLGMSLNAIAQSCLTPASGIVHWWSAEGDAFDQIGELDGSLVGGTSFVAGMVGQAFSFNGVNSRITGSIQGLTNTTDSYTMEFWAYPNAGRATTPETTTGITGTGGQRYAIFPHLGDTISVGAGVSVGTNGVSVFEHGPGYLPSLLVHDTEISGWTHIAVVYENRQPKLYLNGVLAREGMISVNSSHPSTWLGEAGTGYGYYSGYLDEVSIYDRSLSATEVQDIFNAGSSGKCSALIEPSILVDLTNQTATIGRSVGFRISAGGTRPLAYQWWFNDAMITNATNNVHFIAAAETNDAGNYLVVITNSAGAITSSVATLVLHPPVCAPPPPNEVSWWKGEGSPLDQIGNNHGTLAGQATYASGAAGNGFLFDGNGDFVSVGSPAELKVQDFTIETWIKRSSTSIASFQGSLGMVFAWGQGGYGLYLEDSGKPALSRVGLDNVTLGTPVITDTNFHHLAVTKSGSTVVFYVDGVAYPVGAYNSTFTFTSGARIGAWDNPATHSFYGRIDELAVYTRPLDAGEIKGIFEAGSLGKCVPLVPPEFLTQPVAQTVTLSNTATFVALGQGGPPPAYQWKLNGNDLVGATNSSLVVSNALPSKAGYYSLALTNAAGFALSSNALLNVRFLAAFGNGVPLTNRSHAFITNVTVSLHSFFTNGLTFYTLDGSPPSFLSTFYSGPFLVTQNSMLRVLAYSADFFEAGETDPVTILIPPSYLLSLSSGGGGGVSADPSAGPYYLSNSIVTLTATPNAGWSFLKWLGDASGSDPVTNVTMSRDKSVQALFGTSLGTTAAGGGSVALNPPGGTYPYGTTVQLSAIPSAGKFFALWGNAASGNANPFPFVVTNANPTVSSLFAALGGGQVALTVVPVGRGAVSVNPRANSYASGSEVTLTATPEAGQTFLGWSGEATSTQNPLALTLNTSHLIQAKFTARPTLSLRDDQQALAQEGALLTVRGVDGEVYRLESSSNLVDWSLLEYVTNIIGSVQANDPAATNAAQRFYRALMQ